MWPVANGCRSSSTSSPSTATPSRRASVPRTPTPTSCPPPARCRWRAGPSTWPSSATPVLPRVDTRLRRGRRDLALLRLDDRQAHRLGRRPRAGAGAAGRALRETHMSACANNVAFLRRVVRSRAFATADLDTALIERERAALFEAPPLPPRLGGAAASWRMCWRRKPCWRAATPGRAATAGACTAARGAASTLELDGQRLTRAWSSASTAATPC